MIGIVAGNKGIAVGSSRFDVYAVIFVKPYPIVGCIVAYHIGLLPYDADTCDFFLRVFLIDIIGVLPASAGLGAGIGVKHYLIVVSEHKAVGRSGKHSVITVLGIDVKSDIVVVVAAHIEVVDIVSPKVYGIEEV